MGEWLEEAIGVFTDKELKEERSIRIKPSVLRKAHHRAIESQKIVGKWVGEAIKEKVGKSEAKSNRRSFEWLGDLALARRLIFEEIPCG